MPGRVCVNKYAPAVNGNGGDGEISAGQKYCGEDQENSLHILQYSGGITWFL